MDTPDLIALRNMCFIKAATYTLLLRDDWQSLPSHIVDLSRMIVRVYDEKEKPSEMEEIPPPQLPSGRRARRAPKKSRAAKRFVAKKAGKKAKKGGKRPVRAVKSAGKRRASRREGGVTAKVLKHLQDYGPGTALDVQRTVGAKNKNTLYAIFHALKKSGRVFATPQEDGPVLYGLVPTLAEAGKSETAESF